MGFDVNRGREWVNQNSAAVTIGAVVILIFSLAYLWLQNKGPSGSGARTMQFYFYDVQTGEQFVAKGDDLPPITRENGNKAFKAYVFTCGSCSNEAERFVGYYEGFTEDYKQKRAAAIEAAKSSNPEGGPMPEAMYAMEEGISEGRLLSVDGKNWVASDSPEGIEINIALSKACDGKGGQLKPCFPGID